MSQNVFVTPSEENAHLGYYEGAMSRMPKLLVGKVFLTPKYLGFHAFEVRAAGLFGKPKLIPTGKVLGLPLDKVVEATVESGVRSKKSRPNWRDASDFERKASGEKQFNSRPKPLDSAEAYHQLMVTCETESGLEVAMFEVADPQFLVDKIKNYRAKSRA